MSLNHFTKNPTKKKKKKHKFDPSNQGSHSSTRQLAGLLLGPVRAGLRAVANGKLPTSVLAVGSRGPWGGRGPRGPRGPRFGSSSNGEFHIYHYLYIIYIYIIYIIYIYMFILYIYYIIYIYILYIRNGELAEGT